MKSQGRDFMANVRLLFVLFLLASCSSNIALRTQDCESKKTWWHPSKANNFEISSKVWTPLGSLSEREIDLDKILLANELSCSMVETLSVTYESTWADVARSFIPFLSTKTVVIQGHIKGLDANQESQSD